MIMQNLVVIADVFEMQKNEHCASFAWKRVFSIWVMEALQMQKNHKPGFVFCNNKSEL